MMLKLFISYSHKDETQISKFLNHLSPLKNNGVISEWIDRKIETGNEFQGQIDKALDQADIICLMISDNFLASNACMKEKEDALHLKIKKGIRVIPVILSPCMWLVDKDLKTLLATPNDGKPITSFGNENEAWVQVLLSLSKVCESISRIKTVNIKPEFLEQLNSADILTKSHHNKESLKLTDIFVFPKMNFYNQQEDSIKYDSENFTNEIIKYNKIIIAGENQSGKSSLCKMIFGIFRTLNYIPVYIEDENRLIGNPLNKIEKAFNEQYENANITDFEEDRIVPIIDNFHLAKHKEKYIEQYSIFPQQILIVDDLFGLSLKNQTRISEYHKFKIREFTAIERNELIRRWIYIKEDAQIQINQNHFQQSLDEKTELIENSLGIFFGKGIMPSYPFFILSLLAAQDMQKPLDQEITSQGHCYQALIYLYLRKEGVKNDQIDIYSNFLTELAFEMHTKGGNGLSNEDFQNFISKYSNQFNLPLTISEIIKKLDKVNICSFDSLNQYNFSYTYIYYFFVAKFISENIENQKPLIDKIIANLHSDENAYITIFLAHHSKSNYILDELLLNAEIRFEKYVPSTLDLNELSFFDVHEDKIIQAVLPSYQYNVDAERKKILTEKSNFEEKVNGEKKKSRLENPLDDELSKLATDLRLSIKTVEVIGIIIKNRSGSLDINKIQYIYEQGLKVHLRILTSFFDLIRDPKAEVEIVDFLRERVNSVIEEKAEDDKKLNIDQIEKLARSIFWNLNFGVIRGHITKAIHSLGSSNLLNIAKAVSDKLNSPSAFIVYEGICMWYSKNLRIDEIANGIEEKQFSKTATKLIKLKVIEHCMLHKISRQDLQKIETKLNLSSKRLLVEKANSTSNSKK